MEIGIRTVQQHDDRCIARAFVAQVDQPAIADVDHLRRCAAVLGLHFRRIGIGDAKDEEGRDERNRDYADQPQEPFHGAISSIQRRTIVSPSSSTVALPSSGIATPGSGLAMR